VRKLLGAYDVGADVLWGHVEQRRVTGEVVLEFLQDIRRRYPAEVTVYIVMDNLSAHWTPAIRRWAVSRNVGLIPTPTNASHLNCIECHFWAFVEPAPLCRPGLTSVQRARDGAPPSSGRP
jgi:hypothetical protein